MTIHLTTSVLVVLHLLLAAKGTLRLRSVAALLALAMASYFWVDSRYPPLVKKLHSGKAIAVKGAISFDALLPVKPDMPLAVRAGCTTVIGCGPTGLA